MWWWWLSKLGLLNFDYKYRQHIFIVYGILNVIEGFEMSSPVPFINNEKSYCLIQWEALDKRMGFLIFYSQFITFMMVIYYIIPYGLFYPV